MKRELLNIEEIRHVAALARLKVSPAEEERLRRELGAILDYVAKLNELDIENVEPTHQVGESGTPLREDKVVNPEQAELMLSNAPARKGTLFSVPRIIDVE